MPGNTQPTSTMGATGGPAPTSSEDHERVIRLRIKVQGVVQGVGFRPFVHHLAVRHGLAGFVGNDLGGVTIEVEGPATLVERFRQELRHEAPPLCWIDGLSLKEIPTRGDSRFAIVPSTMAGIGGAGAPADAGICDDCLRELQDPQDRRYRYPFVNCAHCGPRYTVIRSLPYDRPLTTMARFPLCMACTREYEDPTDRRHHAQAIACPDCGPMVWLESGEQILAKTEEAVRLAVDMLHQGKIIAVKGIGGFHLACDAANPMAVARLRQRKGRGDKPFAIMVRDLDQARRMAAISDAQARLLTSAPRPIVLLRRSSSQTYRPGPDDQPIANEVAPGTSTLGIMLAYSPLHHLLVTDRPLVMTSGNLADEPIAFDNHEARNRLANLADAFLMHDRDIQMACDDSVMTTMGDHAYMLRRSRGYAPLPVPLPRPVRTMLAVGGELKSALCLTIDQRAIMSQHLGDVASPETLEALEQTANHLLNLFTARAEAVVCDSHPDYLSSHWANRFAAKWDIPLIRIQHHEAHAASLLADAGWTQGPVLFACLDGTGYASDGTIRGGEFLRWDSPGFRRVDSFEEVPLPGGDAAIHRPYRAALGQLWAHGIAWSDDLPCVAICSEAERRTLLRQLERNIACPKTTSAGRLFDAVASLLGVAHIATYEAQAAIALEEVALPTEESYPSEMSRCLRAIIADRRSGVPVGLIAGRFHNTLAQRILEVALRQRPLAAVGLTGGVFQNALLVSRTQALLAKHGFTVLTHRQVPTNDGGLSLGQAWLAAMMDPPRFSPGDLPLR